MYKGNIARVVFGQMGLLTDIPPGQVPMGAMIRANNISFETGLVTKCPGSRRLNTTSFSSPVIAVFDYWPDVVTQRLIVACEDGNLYRDTGDGNFGPDADSGNNPLTESVLNNLTPRSMFVEGGEETAGRSKKLFFFSGSNQLKVLEADEQEIENVASPAADWVTPNFPTVGVMHRNRLWAFMGQIAYASDTGNHENFLTNNLINYIFPGEGGDVTGAFVFKGRLFAFKQGGFVYFLDDADPDSDNWVWRKIANNFGLASPQGLIEIGNDMVAVNEAGSPTSYAAVENFGDIESADLLRALKVENYIRENISLSGLSYLHSIYYEAKKQALFTYKTGAGPYNDTLLVLDYNTETPRVSFWPAYGAQCLALRRDVYGIARPLYGTTDGYICIADEENRLMEYASDNTSVAISSDFITGHMDFGSLDGSIAQKNKLYDFLEVEFKPQGLWNLYVDVYIDGKFSETISFLMDVRDDGLGTFTLGSGGSSGLNTAEGGDGDPLGRDEAQTLRKPLHGSGRRIAFRFRNNGANENFALASINVGFRVSGEQATRV